MKPSRPHAEAVRLSRYECKYFLTETGAEAVRRGIEPFVEPDPFAARYPDYRYELSSLYLDSMDLALYRQSLEGNKNRFKLRIRTYADDSSQHAYLEIKKRADVIVMKSRAAVARAEVAAWLDGGMGIGSAGAMTTMAAREFVSLAQRVDARPVLRVRYTREAYVSRSVDPVRITFDTNLMYALSPSGELDCAGAGWRATPAEGVVLEIKFTDRFPGWIRSLIDGLQLQKQSIPKYALSVDDAIARGPGGLGHHVPGGLGSLLGQAGRRIVATQREPES